MSLIGSLDPGCKAWGYWGYVESIGKHQMRPVMTCLSDCFVFFFILSGVGYVVATSRCSVWQYPLHSWLGISFLRRCRNSGFVEWLCEGYVAFAEWFYSRQQLKLCTRTSMNVTTRIISQYLTISYMHSLSCLQQCFVMFTTQHCRLGTVKLRGDFCTACHCGPANHPNEHKECSTTADGIGTIKFCLCGIS